MPLPLNRELTSRLLGFARVQNNVLYANNSRGKFEVIAMEAVEHVALTLSKLAQDLLLFSLPELGYFTLPPELCTGSSIMPQKKNPDGLELLRARSATIGADVIAVKSTIRSLPSGYNRDFQETKPAFFRCCESGLGCVRIMDLTVEKLTVNADRLRAAFTPEIFATHQALEAVSNGTPFRDAYRQVAGSLGALAPRDPVDTIRQSTSTGTTGNLGLDVARGRAAEHLEWLENEESQKSEAIRRLAGRDVELFRDPIGR